MTNKPYTVADLIADLQDFDPKAQVFPLSKPETMPDGSEALFEIMNPTLLEGHKWWTIHTWSEDKD